MLASRARSTCFLAMTVQPQSSNVHEKPCIVGYRCADGSCVPDANHTCSNGCLVRTPILCSNGSCVSSSANCGTIVCIHGNNPSLLDIITVPLALTLIIVTAWFCRCKNRSAVTRGRCITNHPAHSPQDVAVPSPEYHIARCGQYDHPSMIPATQRDDELPSYESVAHIKPPVVSAAPSVTTHSTQNYDAGTEPYALCELPPTAPPLQEHDTSGIVPNELTVLDLADDPLRTGSQLQLLADENYV